MALGRPFSPEVANANKYKTFLKAQMKLNPPKLIQVGDRKRQIKALSLPVPGQQREKVPRELQGPKDTGKGIFTWRLPGGLGAVLGGDHLSSGAWGLLWGGGR